MVLAYAHRDVGVSISTEFPEFVNGVLLKNAVEVLVVLERLFLLPGVALRYPLVDLRLFHDIVELFKGTLHVADDRQMSFLVLVDFRRVDIDVNDFGLGSKRFEFARHAVVEANAQSDQQVAFLNGPVRVRCTVHSQHVHRQRTIAGIGTQSHHGHGDRNAGLFYKCSQFLTGTGRDDSTTGVNHGTLGQLNRRRDLLDLFWPHLRERYQAIAGQVHCLVPVRNLRAQLHVFRHVNQNGTGTSGRRDVECLFNDTRQIGDIRTQVVMLGNAAANFYDGRFLKRILTDEVCWHLPGNGDHWDTVELRIGNRRNKVRGTRTTGREHNADFARRACITLSRKGTALLVTWKDGTKFVLVASQRLVHRHARSARIGKDDFHAVIH